MVSFTLTVKLPVLVLPTASVAVQVMIASPSKKVAPETAEQVTDGFGSMSSVAVTVKPTAVPVVAVASITRSVSP